MGNPGKKTRDVVHIQQVLDGVLQSCRPEADAGLIEVWRLWDHTVGEAVAENTRPAAFKGRLLLVYAASSSWIHQLQFLKADIIAKLNVALGRELISDIKFKIGPTAKTGPDRRAVGRLPVKRPNGIFPAFCGSAAGAASNSRRTGKPENGLVSQMTDTTTDAFFNGRLQVCQPRTGYRFSIDAVLLAHLAEPRPQDRVLELGTGCGIVSLILAHRMPGVRVTAVELQAELAELARENVRRNGLEARIAVVEADLRTLRQEDTGGPFDMVLSNPPYRRRRSGRINPDPQKAVARHEIESRLSDVIAAARRLLTRSGRFAVIYPAERAAELLTEMRAARIEPKQMRAIHSRLDAEAKLVMVEGASGAGPALKIGPPLAVYGDDGKYTPQVAAMCQG